MNFHWKQAAHMTTQPPVVDLPGEPEPWVGKMEHDLREKPVTPAGCFRIAGMCAVHAQHISLCLAP